MFINGGVTSKKLIQDLGAYEVREQGTRQQYVEWIADRGAFLCCSNFESFGIYYLELLLSGCVGVFLDRPWIMKLLPEYPLVGPKEALLPMMSDLVDRFPYWQERIRTETIPQIQSRYSMERVQSQFLQLIAGE